MMKSAGNYLKQEKHKFIDVWEKEVNQKIVASGTTVSMVLRNLLPNLLEDLGQILIYHENEEEELKQKKCQELIQKSIDHGRHRATSSQYTIKQMIKEYIVLNRVLTRELKSKGLYDMEIGILITYALETSMSHSVSSFSDSIQEMREKLMGTLSHDIRNPVSAAYTAIDMMDCDQGKERLHKLKDMTKKSLRRSLDLMEGLLDAISVKAGEGITMNFTENNLIEEVKKVHDEASQIYYNNIKLHCEEENITAVYDGTAIRRILENLLTNAVKYGAPDQTIDLIVEDHKEKVLLKVHNQGNPISSENKEIVFEFLNRSEEEASGELKSWGMGLAFVKMAAEAHGGHVELVSDQETGTIFTVEIQKHSNQPGKVRSRLNYSKK